MGKRSAVKGAGGERELASILRDHGIPVKRGETRSFGITPDLYGMPGIHIECKRTEQLRVMDWLSQAERDALRFDDGAPTIFWRKNRSPWLVVMKLDDWMKLYEKGGGKDDPC